MAKFDVFVGRRKELALVDEWASKAGTTHLIAVQGDGGVGKTWLLKAIQNRYEQRDDYIVVYWDYAERPTTGLFQIAALYRDWGIQESEFLAGLAELNQKAYDLMPADSEARENQLFQVANDELGPLLQNKRLIYMVDTTEFMATSTERADRFASQLPNALFIAAGRNVKEEKLPAFKRVYGSSNVTYVELSNFVHVESAEFFEAVDREGLIAPDMRAKLHFLTSGRPVLLSLAAAWLSRDVPLPEIAERSLEDLKALPNAETRDLRRRFEFEIVNRIRQLRGSQDRAVLRMAHINRRNDAYILSVLLDISLPEAEVLVLKLAELSFVKYNPATGSCTLHDEVKNLVNRHVWPYIDPIGDVRRKLTRRVIADYYEPRINELAQQVRSQLESDRGPVRRASISDAEWEQWRLEAECLYYRLQISEEEGFAYFEERFLEAQRNNHRMRMQFLLGEMEITGHTDIRDTVELRRAESLRLSGQVEQARAICENALAKEDLSVDNRTSAHVTLGLIAASTDPKRAEGHYKSALQFAQEKGDASLLGVLHNNLGRLYRATSQLGQAVRQYQSAISYSKQAGNWSLVASATNNLAYVYRLQGNLARADAMCRVALVQRKRLGMELDLAYSYLTKAEIDRDRGDLESAEHYTKLALRGFDKVSETRGLAMAYRSLANIHRHLEQYEEAKAYLDEAIPLAKEINDEPLLASLFNVYGRAQRDHAVHLQEFGGGELQDLIDGLFQRSQEYLEQSLELAGRYGDPWLTTRSQLELALVYFLGRARPDDQVADLLNRVWESASRLEIKLLQGYVQEIRGEIALRHEDYVTAARQFGLATQFMVQLASRESNRFFDRISEYLLDERHPPEAAGTLARGILEIIGESAAGEPLQSLQALCQQVLDMQAV